MPAKQVINTKLQGSVATYIRLGGVVNNQIKKGLLLSMRVKKLKSVNIWQSYKQERDCLVHFARLANTLLKTEKIVAPPAGSSTQPQPKTENNFSAFCTRETAFGKQNLLNVAKFCIVQLFE